MINLYHLNYYTRRKELNAAIFEPGRRLTRYGYENAIGENAGRFCQALGRPPTIIKLLLYHNPGVVKNRRISDGTAVPEAKRSQDILENPTQTYGHRSEKERGKGRKNNERK